MDLPLSLAERNVDLGDEPAPRGGFRAELVPVVAGPDQPPEDAYRLATAGSDAWGDVLPDEGEDEPRSARPDEGAEKSAGLVPGGPVLAGAALPLPLAAEPAPCRPDAVQSAA